MLHIILLLIFTFLSGICKANPQIERILASEITRLFPENERPVVRFHNVPRELQELKIHRVIFVRLPDRRGEGQILVDGSDRYGKRRSVYVPFRVYQERTVFIAKKDLSKGETLRHEDLFEKRVSVAEFSNLPSEIEEIEGRKLKRDIKAGTVITRDLIDEPYLVKRGDDVILIVENERLQVMAKGISLERGRLGEPVKVKNSSSGKELVGVVSGEREVRVSF